MDSNRVFDNIQVEKANALARYNRLNNIKKMFRHMEFLVVVALISWYTSYVPNGFKVVGGYLYACSCYVLNQHVVFLLGNFIVLLCYVLSGHTENATTESVAEAIDSATDSVVIRNVPRYEPREIVSQVVPAQLPVVENLPQMKETVAVEDFEGKIVENEDVIVKKESAVVAAKTIKQAAKQLERFKRTQSAILKREMSMRPYRELKRSVTDRRRNVQDLDNDRRKSDADSTVDRLKTDENSIVDRRKTVDRRKSNADSTVDRRKSDADSTVDRQKTDAESSVDGWKSDAETTVDKQKSDADSTDDRRKSVGGSPVDSLSNEEFRLTIEAFILKQHSDLKEQAMKEQARIEHSLLKKQAMIEQSYDSASV